MSETAPKRELTPAQQEALQKARQARQDRAAALKRGETPPAKASKKSSGKARGERAPARPAAPVLTAAQREKVTQGLSLILGIVDTSAAALVPLAWTKEDRFTSDETALLTSGIYAELEMYPALLKRLAAFAVTSSAHTFFAACVVAVAAPRLARRGALSDQLAAQLALFPYLLAATAGGDPVSVAAESASGSSGHEWNGQEHANGVVAPNAAPLPNYAQV